MFQFIKTQVEVQYHTYDTTSCSFNQNDCVAQDRGSTYRLSTYNYLTWLSLSEKTFNVLCHPPRLMCPQWRGLNQFFQRQGKHGATWKAGKEYQVLQNIQANGWRRQMSSLMGWNSWSSLHTYLVYGHTSKTVKAHKMVRDEKKLISKSWVDLSSCLPRTSLRWSHTSSMWTTGLLRACTRSNRGGWRLTWESANHCDHVVQS